MLLHIFVLTLFSISYGADIGNVLNSTSTQAFFKFAEHAGLLDTLLSGNYTVFAPSDAAFAKLPTSVLLALKNDKATLSNMLRYHVIPEIVPASTMENDMKLRSLTGMSVRINKYPAKLMTLVQGRKLTTMLPEATNGLVYVIDGLMKPPQGTILEILGNNTEYSKFYQFATRTKLSGLLNQKDANMTVFVWPNSAWQKLISNDMTTGLQFSNELLTDVGKYHIVPMTLYSKSFKHGQSLPTVQQTDVLVAQILQTGLKINYSVVTTPDISATNGVIHRVDKVLLPPSLLKLAKQFTSAASDQQAVSKILVGTGL